MQKPIPLANNKKNRVSESIFMVRALLNVSKLSATMVGRQFANLDSHEKVENLLRINKS